MTVTLHVYNLDNYPSRISAEESSALYKLGVLNEDAVAEGDQALFEDATRMVEAATAMSHMYGLRGTSAFVLYDSYEGGSWQSFNMLKMEHAEELSRTMVTVMWRAYIWNEGQGAGKTLLRRYFTQMDVPTYMLIKDKDGVLELAKRAELSKLRRLTTGTGDNPDIRILETGTLRLDAIFEGDPLTLNTTALAQRLGCIDDLPSKR